MEFKLEYREAAPYCDMEVKDVVDILVNDPNLIAIKRDYDFKQEVLIKRIVICRFEEPGLRYDVPQSDPSYIRYDSIIWIRRGSRILYQRDEKLDHILCDFCPRQNEDCKECAMEKNKEEIQQTVEQSKKNIEEKYLLVAKLEKELKKTELEIEEYEKMNRLTEFWNSQIKFKSNQRYCVCCEEQIPKVKENILEQVCGGQCYYCESTEQTPYICQTCRDEAKKNNLKNWCINFTYCSICGRLVE